MSFYGLTFLNHLDFFGKEWRSNFIFSFSSCMGLTEFTQYLFHEQYLPPLIRNANFIIK